MRINYRNVVLTIGTSPDSIVTRAVLWINFEHRRIYACKLKILGVLDLTAALCAMGETYKESVLLYSVVWRRIYIYFFFWTV